MTPLPSYLTHPRRRSFNLECSRFDTEYAEIGTGVAFRDPNGLLVAAFSTAAEAEAWLEENIAEATDAL